jgi:transposase
VRFELSEKERKVLREIQHQNNKRDYVKATVLLMLDLQQSVKDIALFLGIDDATVYRHLENYQQQGLDKFLGSNYFGYWGKLSSGQIVELRKQLNSHLYETCEAVCEFVEKRFSVKYTAEGMCDLLHRIGFVYKKTKQIPMKVDEVAQAEFIAQFEQLQAEKAADEVHYAH